MASRRRPEVPGQGQLFDPDNPAALDTATPSESEIYNRLNWLPTYNSASRCAEAAYDRETSQLFVKFAKPYPGRDTYVYEGVAPNEWRNFRRAASAGRYVNRVLNDHDYHRVEV